MDGAGKVIMVGLPKTCTSSVRAALSVLGLRVDTDPLGDDLLNALEAGHGIPPRRYARADVFGDIGVATHWRQLVRLHPKAAFLLTTRSPVHLAESALGVWGNAPERRPPPRCSSSSDAAAILYNWFWRRGPMGIAVLIAAAASHALSVRGQCRVAGVRLYEVDVASERSDVLWRKLSSHLGRALPDPLPPFPRLNRRIGGG
jgi:hypothetical protein